MFVFFLLFITLLKYCKVNLLQWYSYSVASISAGSLLLPVEIVNKSLYGGKYAAAMFFHGYSDII